MLMRLNTPMNELALTWQCNLTRSHTEHEYYLLKFAQKWSRFVNENM